MKLPVGGQRVAVQSLGRERAASTAGAVALADSVAGVVDDYQERKAKHQVSLADARLATWDSDFRKRYDGLDQIQISDLPKHLQKEYASESAVPAFEVRARLYEEELQAALNETADTISNKSVRDEWHMGKQVAAQSRIASRYEERNRQQVDYYNKEALAAADEAVREGHYPIAIHMIESSSLDKVAKDEAKLKVNQAQEQNLVDETLRAGTTDEVRQLHQLYASKDYDGPFDPAMALQAKRALSARLGHLTEVERKQEVGIKAEGAVRQALADPDMPASEQNAMIDAIKDDDIRQEARTRIKARRAEAKRVSELEKAQSESSFLERFRANPDISMIAEAPTYEAEKEARSFYSNHASGKASVTDWTHYRKLRRDVLDGKNVNLDLHHSKLGNTELKELIKLQQAGPDSPMSKAALTVDQDIDARLQEMGYATNEITKGSTRGKRASSMYRVFDTELAIAQEQKGEELSARERRELFDQVQIQTSANPEAVFEFMGIKFGDEDLSLDDIPEDEIPKIIIELRKMGVEPTAANVRQVYIDGK